MAVRCASRPPSTARWSPRWASWPSRARGIGQLLLSDITEDRELSRPDPVFAGSLADLLIELAEIVAAYGTRGTWSETTRDRLRVILADIHDRHRGLTTDVRQGRLPRPDSWSMQGGLLLAVERALRALLVATDQRWPQP